MSPDEAKAYLGVNLPRWGLKLSFCKLVTTEFKCKFTPLGFETPFFYILPIGYPECKFTPLGFETRNPDRAMRDIYCVNLPRWGLKLEHYYEHKKRIECKFTPLGFETNLS